ncbi:LuxR C-terminal-related transcriptional regulator [Kitasatospora sp. NPDC127111]|uniref:LuxR C-terminal-related transcriptional regulator n=1 Tax=Kitasatospora sp. NPDC127111 TaxID=3345363 RepID=UPI003634BD81
MRVIIADDDLTYAQSIADELAAQGSPGTRQAHTVAQLVALIADARPDAVLLDVQMPLRENEPSATNAGLIAARYLCEHHPEVAVLVTSAHWDVPLIAAFLELGDNVAYLQKGRARGEVVQAIRDLLDDNLTLAPDVVEAIRRKDVATGRQARLTDREQDVLALLLQGLKNPAIADSLHISRNTLDNALGNIYDKFGLHEDQDKRVRAVVLYLTGIQIPDPPQLRLHDLERTAETVSAVAHCLRGRVGPGSNFRMLARSGALINLFVIRIERAGREADSLGPGQRGRVRLAGTGGELLTDPCTVIRTGGAY